MLYRFTNCRLDDASRRLERDGAAIAVEPKAFDLLVHLVRNGSRVVGRQELLDNVWSGTKVSDAAINRCIMVARQAIGDVDPDNRVISTIHGRGFRFMAPVTVADTTAAVSLPAPPLGGLGSLPEPPSGPFAGRVEELRRLHSAWQEALRGRRQAVLIAGEPGIGKTRLSMEEAAQAQADGALILIGRCDDELAVPFQPFLEVLDQFVRWSPPSSLRLLLGRYAAELQRLLPDLLQLVPDLAAPTKSDAETERFRLFAAVAEWLRELSQNVPVVLILDDLHWATKETGLLFRHLVRTLSSARLLIIATYRDTDVQSTQPFADVLADVQREAGVQHISLSGLDLQSVGALLAAAGSEAPADHALVAEVQSYAQGNALFVSEIIRHLRESGKLNAAGKGSALRIPLGIRATVQRRVRRLSDACRDLLSWGCVVGAEVSERLLAAVTGLPIDELANLLDPACQARILEAQTGGVYRFSHRLVRDALYEELGPALRSVRHRKVAEAIETTFAGDLDPHLGALAFHHAHSVSGEDTRQAIDYAVRAGERARGQLANDQAAAHFATALRLLEAQASRSSEHVDLLIRLGEAQRDCGSGQYRETLLEAARRARQSGDAAGLARAVLANSQGWAAGIFSRDEERINMLEAALEAIGPADAVLRARLLANLMGELSFANVPERLQALDEEALGMARRLGDLATLSYVLRLRALPRWTPELFAERRALSIEQLAIAEELGDPHERWWGLNRTLATAVEQGDFDEVLRRLEQLRVLTEDLGQAWLRWHLENLECLWALHAGDVEKAEAIANRALEMGIAMGRVDAMAFFIVHISSIRFMQGRIDELIPQLQMLIASSEEASGVRAVVADALAEIGRHSEAVDLIDQDAKHGFTQFPYEAGRLSSLMHHARASFYIEAREPAAILYRRLQGLAGQVIFNGVSMLGSVDACLALLAAVLQRFDEAEAHFEAAHAINERMQRPYWSALTLVDWASVSAQRGHTGRAGSLAEQASDIAVRFAFHGIERRSKAILDGLQAPGIAGRRPRRAPRR